MISFARLNERITLLFKQSFADDDGKTVVREVFSLPCWAYLEPVHSNQQKMPFVSSGKNTAAPMFKVYVRAIPGGQEDDWREDRHAKVNALRWRHKEYELLCPFSASDKAGRFREALCIEGGK
jgi:head-tail adaptor